MKYPLNMQTGEQLDQGAASEWFRVNGDNRKPDPPRNAQAQSGARKVLVTWDAPVVSDGIIGYKVYTNNENQLFDTIYDPNVRQYSVPASSGATPPVINVFISSFSKKGESETIQVQGSATAEAGAPADPSPPTDSAASGNTGKSFGIDGSDAAGDAGFTR